MKLKYMDPSTIVTVVVVMVVLAVGLFSFMTVLQSFQSDLNTTKTNISGKSTDKISDTLFNVSKSTGSLFNIMGVVMIVGTIMVIIEMTFSYLGTHEPRERKRRDPGMPYSEALKKQAEKKAEQEFVMQEEKEEKHDSFSSWKKHHGK